MASMPRRRKDSGSRDWRHSPARSRRAASTVSGDAELSCTDTIIGVTYGQLTPKLSWYEAARPPRQRGGSVAPHRRNARSVPQQPTGRPAVDSIGIDLHKRESQLCTITTDGELIEQRIVTSRARFTAVLGPRAPARILLEASTESEWVARHLGALGHVVIVADPGFAALYATRSKRVKTDKRDARTLCEALQLGAYRAVHR